MNRGEGQIGTAANAARRMIVNGSRHIEILRADIVASPRQVRTICKGKVDRMGVVAHSLTCQLKEQIGGCAGLYSLHIGDGETAGSGCALGFQRHAISGGIAGSKRARERSAVPDDCIRKTDFATCEPRETARGVIVNINANINGFRF